MGEETARLRREIDRTREDLTRDVDMIYEKASPSRIVERRVRRTRHGIAGLRDRVMGHRDDAPDTWSPDRQWSATPDDPYGAGYYGADEEQGMADRLRGGVGSARERASGASSTMTDRMHRAGDRAGGTARGTVSTARERTEGNPLAAGLVAFGVGWLVSSLLPATEAETQAARRAQDRAKEHGGPLVEQAKQAASEIGENLRGSAQEAVEQVKGHAQEAAQTVKDEGTSAAQTVKDEGTSAAQTVKDDAKGQASGRTTGGTSGGTTGGTSGGTF